MSVTINYQDLFYMTYQSIKRTKEFITHCPCANCDNMKRAKTYYNVLKHLTEKPENRQNYMDLCKIMFDKEETGFVNNFLITFLRDIDEEGSMAELDDKKDTMINLHYLDLCNMLLNVKKFKDMIKVSETTSNKKRRTR